MQLVRLRGAWPIGSGCISYAARDGRELARQTNCRYTPKLNDQVLRAVHPSGTVTVPPPTQARTPVVLGAEVGRPRATLTAR